MSERERRVCRKCCAPMESGAVLCIHCGYDTRSGKHFGAACASSGRGMASRPWIDVLLVF
jgi:hypothetical protein